MAFLYPESYICLPQIQVQTFFSKFIYPLLFLSGIRNSLLTPHPAVSLVCLLQYFLPVSLVLVSVTHPPHILSLHDVKSIKQTSHIPTVQHLWENSKSASTKRGTILAENAARTQTRNLYRETGSVYFYLINVNLLSHLSERNVELVNVYTGHIFIGYKFKKYPLSFLHSSG